MKVPVPLLLTILTSVLAVALWDGLTSRSPMQDPTASETLLQTLLDGTDGEKPLSESIPAEPSRTEV
ncbi:hypothetical protein DBR45_29125 [Pseudomonas sp. HMWF031]|nr:hypothetical protein DBR45_29125 [Pseudomonas sp. HMWF031]